MEPVQRVPLSEAVRSVRNELAAAMAQGSRDRFQLHLGPVELELAIEIGGGPGAQAEVGVWVVPGGVGESVGQEATHRLRITLELRAPDGSPVAVAGEAGVERWDRG
jgi:Trypsin-co-occurring domain 2